MDVTKMKPRMLITCIVIYRGRFFPLTLKLRLTVEQGGVILIGNCKSRAKRYKDIQRLSRARSTVCSNNIGILDGVTLVNISEELNLLAMCYPCYLTLTVLHAGVSS